MSGRGNMLRPGVLLAWSVAVWVALWGRVTPANVLWGLVLGAVTLWAVPLSDTGQQVPIRPFRMLHAIGFFAWSLLKSSAVVAFEIVRPNSQVSEGIVEVPLRTRSRGLITLIGNAVSLTPGTLTLEARHDPPTLWVHVLHLQDIDSARDEIRRVEDVMLQAFGHEPDAEGMR